MNLFKYLFNWKQHPIRILYVLIPIIILKFGYLLAYSVAQINVNDDWFPLAITILGFIILNVCVWPLYRIIRESEAEKKLKKEQKIDENDQKN
jgi:integral membrane sensor domain MASE1